MKRRLLEIWVTLTADKRKAAALGVMAAVALAMWARALLVTGPAPAHASAETKPARGAGASGSHVSGGGATSAPAESEKRSGKGTRKDAPVDSPAVSLRVVRIPAIAPLSRDLFAPNGRHFPPSSQTDAVGEEPPKSLVGNDETSAEQEARQREELVREVRTEAEGLRLRSVMLGGSALAVIETKANGKPQGVVLRVGQMVNGFTLIEVRSDGVRLEKGGVVVELFAQHP